MNSKIKQIKRIINYLKENEKLPERMSNEAAKIIIEALEDKLNPDVVKDTRCKGCWKRYTPDCDMTCCNDMGEIISLTDDSDYCSYGEERKE